jgi:hypothetical protein
LQELGVLAGGEQASTDDAAWVLQKLQRLFDRWNAKRVMVYANTFTSFALPTSTMPVTIGPTGLLVVSQRPVEIPSIGLVLNSSAPSEVEIFLNARDKDWWAQQNVKNLLSDLPTDYYYEPDWPNGSIYFWPVPTQANNVLIQQRGVIAQITSYEQSFTMPPGYWDATVYELALSLAPSFSRQPNPLLVQYRDKALRELQANNIASPVGIPSDPSMPGTRRVGGFNYVTAQPS